jgi:hypothetical protein
MVSIIRDLPFVDVDAYSTYDNRLQVQGSRFKVQDSKIIMSVKIAVLQ